MKNARVILVHDLDGLPKPFADAFTYRDLPTIAMETAKEALDFIESPKVMKLDCAIFHKDLGDYSGEGGGQVDKVVRRLHDRNPTVRVGIVSGEYPHGEKHVLKLGADFYFPTNELYMNQEWVKEQAGKGPALPKEIEMRGQRVETPMGHFGSGEFKG